MSITHRRTVHFWERNHLSTRTTFSRRYLGAPFRFPVYCALAYICGGIIRIWEIWFDLKSSMTKERKIRVKKTRLQSTTFMIPTKDPRRWYRKFIIFVVWFFALSLSLIFVSCSYCFLSKNTSLVYHREKLQSYKCFVQVLGTLFAGQPIINEQNVSHVQSQNGL